MQLAKDANALAKYAKTSYRWHRCFSSCDPYLLVSTSSCIAPGAAISPVEQCGAKSGPPVDGRVHP